MESMRMDRFQDLLDRRGCDVAAWPPDERRAAEGLLATSPEARAALARAGGFDRLMAQALAPEAAPAALRVMLERLPQAAGQARQAAQQWWENLRLAWSAGAALVAVSLAAGILVGATGSGLPGLMRQTAADMAGIIYPVDLDGTL
jgi:anti-sigma factor RsiW